MFFEVNLNIYCIAIRFFIHSPCMCFLCRVLAIIKMKRSCSLCAEGTAFVGWCLRIGNFLWRFLWHLRNPSIKWNDNLSIRGHYWHQNRVQISWPDLVDRSIPNYNPALEIIYTNWNKKTIKKEPIWRVCQLWSPNGSCMFVCYLYAHFHAHKHPFFSSNWQKRVNNSVMF